MPKKADTPRKAASTPGGRRILQNWDAETHEAILLALIEHIKPNGNIWGAVVASLHAKGYTFTEGALVYVDFGLNHLLIVYLLLAIFPLHSLLLFDFSGSHR